jgi:hypothetical protein
MYVISVYVISCFKIKFDFRFIVFKSLQIERTK